MNYTVPSTRPIIINKDVKLNRKMSAECKARMDFIASHRYSVTINPETKQPVVKVTKK